MSQTTKAYYTGNIEEDLTKFSELPSFIMFAPKLKTYGQQIGFGRMQQMIRQSSKMVLEPSEAPIIENLHYLEKQWGADNLCKVIQVLWAECLSEKGSPTIGALYHEAKA